MTSNGAIMMRQVMDRPSRREHDPQRVRALVIPRLVGLKESLSLRNFTRSARHSLASLLYHSTKRDLARG